MFTTLVSPSTPVTVKLFYGVWMCGVNAAWFMAVSVLFSHQRIRERFLAHSRLFDNVIGTILLLFAGGFCWLYNGKVTAGIIRQTPKLQAENQKIIVRQWRLHNESMFPVAGHSPLFPAGNILFCVAIFQPLQRVIFRAFLAAFNVSSNTFRA